MATKKVVEQMFLRGPLSIGYAKVSKGSLNCKLDKILKIIRYILFSNVMTTILCGHPNGENNMADDLYSLFYYSTDSSLIIATGTLIRQHEI